VPFYALLVAVDKDGEGQSPGLASILLDVGDELEGLVMKNGLSRVGRNGDGLCNLLDVHGEERELYQAISTKGYPTLLSFYPNVRVRQPFRF